MDALRISNVSAGYRRGADVLTGVSLVLDKGTAVGVLGSNGSGKSTLLRVISGLLAPTCGEIEFFGRRVTGLSTEALCRLGIVMLPEGHRVISPLTVHENLQLATMHLSSWNVRKILNERLGLVYELFPLLKERRNEIAGLLSGGQQQMLSIGRALVQNPRVLMLDEPSLGLAPMVVSQIYDAIRLLREKGMSLLIVEQGTDRLEKFCDQLLVLREGRVTFSMQARDVKTEDLHSAYFG
jgi:branched-chain amino acid transport system ATP-binding protein